MDFDIVIYAIIAILIFARLWSVLGQNGNEDHERPNPFAPRPPSTSDIPPTLEGTAQIATPLLLQPMRHAPDSLAGGLEQIRNADPSFNEKQFLQGARDAFTLILNDFAKGDLAESARLLGPTVLPHFREAIEKRRTAGHVMEHKLSSIREAECVAAKLDNGHANIVVRFVSAQESVMRDSAGKIVEGTAGKLEELTDLWTFSRDTASADPNWVLIETKS